MRAFLFSSFSSAFFVPEIFFPISTKVPANVEKATKEISKENTLTQSDIVESIFSVYFDWTNEWMSNEWKKYNFRGFFYSHTQQHTMKAVKNGKFGDVFFLNEISFAYLLFSFMSDLVSISLLFFVISNNEPRSEINKSFYFFLILNLGFYR